jgi:hypothetical protein
LFSEEENPVHAEYFRNEDFVSKLVYVSDIFEKLNALDTSRQGNGTNIMVMNHEVEALIGQLGLWVRKLEGKGSVSSCEGFCGEKQCGKK